MAATTGAETIAGREAALAEEAPTAAPTEAGEGGEREGGRRRGRGGRDRPRREETPGSSAEGATDADATLVLPPEMLPTVTAAEPSPAPAVAPVPPRAAEPIVVPRYELPADELATLARTAGLEWVHSDTEKIRLVQEAMAAAPRPVRAPREPRRQVLVDEGPLVLVETRKDLSQLKLPFEQPGA